MNPNLNNFNYTPGGINPPLPYTPQNQPPSSQPPPPAQPPFRNSRGNKFFPLLIGIVVVTAIVGGTILTLAQLQKQQEVRSKAAIVTVQWYTSQSATTACSSGGTGVISANFTNTETSSDQAMNVIVKDNQTGKTVDIGTVGATQTKTGKIDTGIAKINSGSVTFNLSWTNGSSGTDSRTASYPAVGPCPVLTPTPTPTSKPTNTPTPPPYGSTPTPKPTATPTPKYGSTPTPPPIPTPTSKPTNTPTPPPYGSTPTPRFGSTPTPTPTACPTPGTVKNIKIICPYCSPTPSSGV